MSGRDSGDKFNRETEDRYRLRDPPVDETEGRIIFADPDETPLLSRTGELDNTVMMGRGSGRLPSVGERRPGEDGASLNRR